MAVLTLFGQTGAPGSVAVDPAAYTMGPEFHVTASGCTLTGVWFNSATGAGNLPQTIALYQSTGAGTGTLVHSESASWSGAAASGWVRAAFASPPSLTSGTKYKAVVFDNAAGGSWYSSTANYWSSGAGSGGITNGSLTAPNNAGSVDGQDCFNATASLAYPASTFNATNYWVDPEVTTSGASHSATVTSTATPSTVTHRGIGKALTVTVTPATVVARAHQTGRTIAATVTPATVIQISHRRAKSGGYYDYHHRAAQR